MRLPKSAKSVNAVGDKFIEYGEFELNDGNHRHKAYENLGIKDAWVIIWITEKEELDDFMDKYGDYVKDCRIIQR